MHRQKSGGKPTFPTHEIFFVDDLLLPLKASQLQPICSQQSEAPGEKAGLTRSLNGGLRSRTPVILELSDSLVRIKSSATPPTFEDESTT